MRSTSIFNRFTVVHERICQLYPAWKTIFISLSALYYEQLDDERFNVLFNSVSVKSGWREDENERLNALEHRLRLGAPVAQWVKRWSTDLAVPSSISTRGEILSTVNGVPLHTAFHFQPHIVLIWLKYCWKGRKIASLPSTHRLQLTRFPPLAGMELGTARSVGQRLTHCAMGLLSLQKSLAESPARKWSRGCGWSKGAK